MEEVLEGFNCTIFAYGQTGTGKTYTMEGGDRDSEDGTNLSDVAGVIPRAIHHIFTTLDSNDSEYTVKCWYDFVLSAPRTEETSLSFRIHPASFCGDVRMTKRLLFGLAVAIPCKLTTHCKVPSIMLM